jgi:PKD repeat protein
MTKAGNLYPWLRSAFWAAALVVILMIGSVQAADFVIVVDVSGSMTDPVGRHDKRVRITVVQDALRQYLPALPAGSRIDLIAFNTGIVAEKEVILKDDKDLSEALAWVDSLPSKTPRKAQTYLWTTLRHALQIASRYSKEQPTQPVTVRALTDGEDNENVTTLDNVLQEFLPLLDGEKIAGNLVLLGDLELKTKLTLPEGAFETTKNPTWEVLFPPIVLWAPAEPKIGEEVRLFENNTRSIYKDYEWQVDGTAVGKEKVLTWQFTEARSYRVTLKVTGLQGTKNSATVLVRVKERVKLVVDFVASTAQPEPRKEVKFIGRCSGQGVTFAWFVNSNQVANTQDLIFRFDQEGKYDVKLVALDAVGSSGVRSQTIQVKEQILTASIKGPGEVVSGREAQFAGEITGPCTAVEWRFGDGTTSAERNPQHTFECRDSAFKDHTVSLSAVSPAGKAVESTPHTIRVWAEKMAPAPQAMFRILTQNPKVGDPIQLVDETTGPAETVQWDVDGELKNSVRNPEFHVSTPGEKTIRMTVRGPGGESVITKKITVYPRYAQPVVWCGASKVSGTAPLTVAFTNRIAGDYKRLLWTFGDGQSSTNSSPCHTFAKATNYVVSLTVAPMDSKQPDMEQRVVIKVIKPWPFWAKATAAALPSLMLIGYAAFLILHRRRKALRLHVYYWAEQASICQTVVLTKEAEVVDLSPAAPLRLKREGRTQNLIVQPIEGSTLFAASGQEASMLSVGDGLRVTARDARGLTRALAISIRQKPCRPSPAADESETLANAAVCGLLKSTDSAQAPAESEEFNWGLDTASTKGE